MKNRQLTPVGIQPIDKTLMVATGLRWLKGSGHEFLADIFHFSDTSSKRIVRRVINVIMERLYIHLPTLPHGLNRLTKMKGTHNGNHHGPVLALDAFF
jgi:hypothetical protein